MIDLARVGEWQNFDPVTGLTFPWFTKDFLDVLTTWDFKHKRVFEFGVGASTKWFIEKGAWVNGVDSNYEWSEAVGCAKFKTEESDYVNTIFDFPPPDIVVIDGIYRDECVEPALKALNGKGILIIDNYLQPSVWVATEENQKILSALNHKIYKQEGHPDWQTYCAQL